MSKVKQSTAIEQVMDELNEEMPSSVQTSPNLFSPDLLNEPTKAPHAEDSLVRVGTALSIEPNNLEEPEPPKKSKKAKKKSLKKSGQKADQKLAQKAKKKPAQSIDEPASQEELSELENLLSFEPNRHNYQEELSQTGGGQSSKVFPNLGEEGPDSLEDLAQEDLAQDDLDQDEKQEVSNNSGTTSEATSKDKIETQNKKNLVQGAIGKMAGFYNQTVDPGIAISLKQSENLRVAQERIIALEGEIDRLRKENEELISAGDIFRERIDKISIQNDNLKKSYEENREEFQEEKRTLMHTLNDQSREMDKMAIKNKELEKRLSSNIQQIRVRERELENRLELMKLDTQTLVREKDQYILDLKRQIDKIKMDIETQKNRYTETEQKLKGQKDQTRRAARGLQMALHILKGHDFSLEEKETKEE